MGDLKGVEALRGLAAMGIATYSWLWAIGMADAPPAANLYLLYDLFFVISGFVIAQVYRARLTSGREAARFALLRFGRVYPLHLAVLLLMLAFQTLGPGGGLAAPGALGSFIGNLAMLQGLGVIGTGLWNAPAWFISAEFALSILFALLCLADIPRRAIGLGALICVVGWSLWMLGGRPDGLPVEGPELPLRGFAGFMLGVLAQAARRARFVIDWLNELGAVTGTLWTVAALLAVGVLIGSGPPEAHVAAPVIFAGLILLVSGAPGAVRRILSAGALQTLARISFGVFMCHWLLAGAVRRFVESAAQGLAVDLSVTPVELVVLSTPLYLLMVLALAVIAERWVERPTRDAMRAWIERRSRSYVSGARRRSDVV